MASGITLAIIPARGGSKRIPKKNIVNLCDKPLIYYTINAAKKSKYINEVIVSTDDVNIKDISIKYEVEVIMRPNALATDTSPTIDTIIHLFNVLIKREKKKIDLVVLLQPSSPLRTSQDVDEAVSLFLGGKCESVISVSESRESPYWSHTLQRGFLIPLLGLDNYSKRSQDLPKTYIENGAIYISKPDTIIKYHGFYTPSTVPYIMPYEHSVDIDTPLDLAIAEVLVRNEQ